MQQRGRKSGASLATITPINVTRWEPPADLHPYEAMVWRKVVGSVPSDWFNSANVLLLKAYCSTCWHLDTYLSLLRDFDPACLKTPEGLKWHSDVRKEAESWARLQTSQATKMRITQQSVYRADTAGVKSRQVGASGMRPWLDNGEEGDQREA